MNDASVPKSSAAAAGRAPWPSPDDLAEAHSVMQRTRDQIARSRELVERIEANQRRRPDPT